MEKCHKDEYMDSLIGRKVTITFKDGSDETGIIAYPVLGIGYAVKTPSCDVAFCKSHVRCIKVLP